MPTLVRKRESFETRWLYIVVLYLFIDLARIQSILPIEFLRPGLIVIILLVICLLFNGKNSYFIDRQILLILFFVSLLTVYVPFVTNNFLAYQVARNMWLKVPFILSIPILINSRNRLLYLVWVFVAILLFVSCYGLMHGGRGPGGSISDENDLCLFLVTFLPFVFFLVTQQKKKLAKFILFAIVLIVLLATVATFSRGGFVGLVAMGAVYWWYGKRKLLIMFCFALLILVASIYGGEAYRQDMTTVTDTSEGTASERLLSWEAGWNMFIDHPLGVGGNNFPVHFSDYQPPELRRNMWGRVAHSLWFTLIPETGIVGILIYFLIIRLNYKDLKLLLNLHNPNPRKTNDNFYYSFSITMIASFVGFFASASFLAVLYYPEFWYLTAIVVATKNLAIKAFNQSSAVQEGVASY